MSDTTFPRRQPAAAHTSTARAPREPQPETTSDHGYLIKVIAAVLAVTVTVSIIAPLGWAGLPAGVAVLLVMTAAVLHATLRLLNETD